MVENVDYDVGSMAPVFLRGVAHTVVGVPWDVRDGDAEYIVADPQGGFRHVAFGPDGTLLMDKPAFPAPIEDLS